MRNYVGKTFGRLTVTEFSHTKTYGEGHSTKSFWSCRCACGNTKVVIGENLVSGNTTSCGCLSREVHSKRMKDVNKKHGLSHLPEYSNYASMLARIIKPDAYHQKYYKNVTVCEQWLGLEGFQNFYRDMGPKPTQMHSIDRIDNVGDYTPENCRWATKKEQANNRRLRNSVV